MLRCPLAVRTTSIATLVLSALNSTPAAGQATPDTAVIPLDTMRVELGRLPGESMPLARSPHPVQVIGAAAIAARGGLTLADALQGTVGLSTASQFGSPLQPDVRFRGFQVGPVVGFPQSVSVFVDGVRVNEPDASQVNFDLIPTAAIERIELVRAPGGAFGRNTLAGALNIVTRDASGDDAGAVEATAGAFGERGIEGWGVAKGPGSSRLFAAARYHRIDGWRDLSASMVRQLYIKSEWQSGGRAASLSYTFADNHIEGPGSLPSSWLNGELPPGVGIGRDPRELQFTGFDGDLFTPRLHFGTARLVLPVGATSRVQLNGFVRSNRIKQFNDNITEPNVRGETDILSAGATAQLSGARANGAVWAAGLEAVSNRTDILIFEVANPAFPAAGGMTESVTSDEVNLGAFTQLWWPFSESISANASLRYDHVSLPVTDRLDPENSGSNTFGQVTGSIGGEVAVAAGVRAFASYGHGFRAPVILEISCADPLDPCPLPFELGADPPLEAVTADTWQAGLRHHGAAMHGEVVAYWTEVHDDLFAVVAPPSTRGYFTNLDRTRRQGLELSGALRATRRLTLDGSVALVRATFQSRALLASALLDDDDDADRADADPGAGAGDEEGGATEVEPGDHFAMVPNISGHLEAAYTIGAWQLALGARHVGSQYFIGDESNERDFGRLPAYTIMDAGVEYTLGAVVLALRADNLLDREYETFGIIAPNVRGPRTEPQPFLSPGTPLRLRLSARVEFR